MASPPVEAITLTEAATRFGPEDEEGRLAVRRRIESYLKRGTLERVERAPGRGPNGLVLVDANEVARLLANPPRRGPRPKS